MQVEIDPLRTNFSATKRTDELTGLNSGQAENTDSGNDAGELSIRESMARLYDYYYASDAYHQRYPVPNASMLAYVLKHGAEQAKSILDFGCGNGRYALPLLERTQAIITGYDISIASLAEFSRYLENAVHRDRIKLIHGDLDQLGGDGSFEVILMLFGVLSHIGLRNDRLAVLKKLRALIKPKGRLIISVPNIYRRRPLDLLSCTLSRLWGNASRPLRESGNIYFHRNIGGRKTEFFYHLYSISDLRNDLSQSGFSIHECHPESFLPEWLVTQYRLAAWLDGLILPILPTALGYGICVLADPV